MNNKKSDQTVGASPQDEEMLPVDPPPVASRLLAWLMISIFGVAFLVSVLVKIPETVRCRFVLISEAGSDPIQARLFAVLHAVSVEEGQLVEEGDELFVLKSDEIRGWQTQRKKAVEDRSALEKRTRKGDESHEKQMEILQGIADNARREVEFGNKHLENSRAILKRMEGLFTDKIISEIEIEEYRLNENQSQKNLFVASNTLEKTSFEQQQLETDRERERAAERAEDANLTTQIAALEEQLENCVGDLMIIRAPYDGVVIHIPNRNTGSVVDEGYELCQLARVDGKAVGRLSLDQDGLPKIESGLPVRYFFDAFPYQRYGTVTGELEWVSPAAIVTPDGSRFVARSSLSATNIVVNSKMVRPLQIGMKGEARIQVDGLTLMQYAYEPIRQLKENLKYTPLGNGSDEDSSTNTTDSRDN